MKSYLRRKDEQQQKDSIPYLSDRIKDEKEKVLEESSNFTVLKHQCGYLN